MGDIKLGLRIKALREKADLSQEQMARLLKINDRQTISQIEADERRLKAEELLIIVSAFNVPLEVLTNPFLLIGEAKFSWRQHNVPGDRLDDYEQRAGEWIGAYRALHQMNGESFPAILPRLGLEKTSRYEDAVQAAEAMAEQLGLGDVPARKLAQVMEEQLQVLVLMVDAIDGVSGAACQLPELGCVLVNRHEPEGRRHFDLAHELFHILTWTAMPPERLDGETPKSKRVEQLADNFASALLAPSKVLDALGPPEGDLRAWLNRTADHLGMSAQALKWRMINSERVSREDALSISDDALRHNGAMTSTSKVAPLFSRPFVTTLVRAIDKGNISVRRAMALVDMAEPEFRGLCEAHVVPAPAEL